MKIILLCIVFYMPYVLCIIGGRDVPEVQTGVHRFVVSIQTEQQNGHICGGAIIAINFVLTAATCVKDKRPQDLFVMGGIRHLSEDNRIQLNVDEIISKNPSGQNQVHNNIALLRLTEDIPWSDVLQKVDLPRHNDNPPDEGKACEFFGWGQKVSDKPVVTNTLQMARTKVSKLSKCRSSNKDVDESNICTYDVNAGLCKFDTGDPLVSDGGHNLWGIATDQHSCGTIMDDVYTRVDSHLDWIEEVMNETSTIYKPQMIALVIIALLTKSFN